MTQPDDDALLADDLPIGDGMEGDFDDDGGLYVDFTDREAASESMEFEPLPTGRYLTTIDDVEIKESKSAKNPGKPMYNFRFNVIDDLKGGEFEGRKCYTLAMTWSPALYTITHIMNALGLQPAAGRFKIPPPSWFMGKTIVVSGKLVPKREVDGKVYEPRFEPKAFFAEDTWGAIKSGRSPKAGTGKVTAARSSADSDLV